MNSVEPMANQYLEFALGHKLDPVFKIKDSAMRIIQTAVVLGYENSLLDKFRGLVFSNGDDYLNGIHYLSAYLVKNPGDFDALSAIAICYFRTGSVSKAKEYIEKARRLNTGGSSFQLLYQQIQQAAG